MGALPVAGVAAERRRGALLIFAVSGSLLLVVYFAVPAASLGVRLTVSMWALAAFAFGVRSYRPRHAEAWVLLAASLAVFQVADVSDFGLPASTRPGPADWISFVGYGLAAAGLARMVRSRTVGRDAAGFLDALIAAIAIAFPAWIYVVAPLVDDSALMPGVRAASVVPPIGDLVLLGIIARLLVTAATRSASIWLLSGGVVVCAVADACEGLWRLGAVPWFGSFAGQTLMAAGWMGYCLFWGAAALVPSMRQDTEPARGTGSSDVLPARIAALTAIALVVPVVAFVQQVRAHSQGGRLGLILGTAIFVLVIVRIGLVITNHRRALDGEQALLAASEALARASTADEVAASLSRTVARLFGAASRHRSVVAVVDQGRVCVAPAERDGEGVPVAGTVRDADPGRWREVLAGTGRAVPPDARPEGLVAAAALPPPLDGELAGQRQAIAFPLGTAVDDPWCVGVLAVSGSERAVLTHAASLEILAGQAALCLSRIDLNREIARRDGARYFQTLVQHDSDAILIVGHDLGVRYASPSAEGLFGLARVADRPLDTLLGPANTREVAARLADPELRPPLRRDWRLTPAAGGVCEVEATLSDLRDEPTVAGLVVSLRDVTEAREMERALYRQAYRDELTGLPNRAAFELELGGALTAARPDETVHVLLAYVDHFLEIDDAHGRDVGDEVLRATAGALPDHLGPRDVLARIGVDEFATLLRRPAGEPVELPPDLPGERGPFVVGPATVTLSGALVDAGRGATAEALMADAEITLHAVKQTGRPRTWRRYDPVLRTELERVATLRSGLTRALADREFALVYQPIVRMTDRGLAGFESLVRWPQPDGTVLGPDLFVPLAEATGQILGLGRWILRTATAQAAAWNRDRAAAGRGPLRVTVNVSAHELRVPTFAEAVAEALEETGLDPDLLVLEATESALIRYAGPALANLRATAALGVRLALDDFGTGYSSLSYLRDLPATGLKIDKSFVRGLDESPRQLAVVEGIIGIGRALGLTIIAEGIETEEQYLRLRDLGADRGQGWLFGKPMPCAEAGGLVRAGEG